MGVGSASGSAPGGSGIAEEVAGSGFSEPAEPAVPEAGGIVAAGSGARGEAGIGAGPRQICEASDSNPPASVVVECAGTTALSSGIGSSFGVCTGADDSRGRVVPGSVPEARAGTAAAPSDGVAICDDA